MPKQTVLKTYSREEFGDFQTPAELVDLILSNLFRDGRQWSRALEPTCGLGSFIKGLASLRHPPREIQAIEVQPNYVEIARGIARESSDIRVQIHEVDLFRQNLSELRWSESGPLLVVGNPPWVTNAALSALGSSNLPIKSNFKNLKGLEALTGDANFDIAEYIWIKLIRELAWCRPTVALLCKTQVARNVLRFASNTGLPLSNARIYRIDAKKSFGAAVDACLFSVDVECSDTSYDGAVFSDLRAIEPDSVMGVVQGKLVSHSGNYERLKFLDGECRFTWRQGLKHDLSAVMEVEEKEGRFFNRAGEQIDVEFDYLYPLLKSSDLQPTSKSRPRLSVIVPQQALGEDTTKLQSGAPKLWAYLSSHLLEFDARKSIIYLKRSPFSIFGIGPYSFSPHKVAISGLYKKLHFRVVGPWRGKPVMLDDTCYFIPCDSAEQACTIGCLLNQPSCIEFIHSLVFLDSKRPVTKKILQRVDLNALFQSVDRIQLMMCVERELKSIGGAFQNAAGIDLEQYIVPEPKQPKAQYQLPEM